MSGKTIKEHCCGNCINLGGMGPSHDQPYPEIWCSKGKWDGISSYEELYEVNDCDEFNIDK